MFGIASLTLALATGHSVFAKLVEDPGRNKQAVTRQSTAKYTGADLFSAIFFGRGPAAGILEGVSRHAEPVFAHSRINDVQAELILAIQKRDPAFFNNFAADITSDNPVRVRKALVDAAKLGESMTQEMKQKMPTTVAQGYTYTSGRTYTYTSTFTSTYTSTATYTTTSTFTSTSTSTSTNTITVTYTSSTFSLSRSSVDLPGRMAEDRLVMTINKSLAHVPIAKIDEPRRTVELRPDDPSAAK